MLNFGPEKLFLVGVIALIVLGPDRLPQAARTLGRFVAQARRMSAGFQEEVRDALADPSDAVSSAMAEFRVPDIRRSVREAVTSTFEAPLKAVPPPEPLHAAPSPLLPVGETAPAAPDDPSLN